MRVYYVFASHSEAADVTTRMFAPEYGIFEEQATGMAAVAACRWGLLHDDWGSAKRSREDRAGCRRMDSISQKRRSSVAFALRENQSRLD